MIKLKKSSGRLVFFYLFVLFSSAAIAENAAPKNRGITNAWKLPSLILKDLQGQSRNLYDWHGRVIMLNFWATWCRPCQIEIPDFIAYQQRYEEKGLQIIGVGLDKQRPLRNFVRTLGINYPVLQADPEQQFALLKQWGDASGVLPFTVIIASDGQLVFMQQGILDKATFSRIVEPLLD